MTETQILATEKGHGLDQLDTVRLVLAMIVVIAHANYIFITPLGITAFFDIFQWCSWSAVMAFFVLSGFVIGRSLRIRRDGILPFLYRRVMRIYPPLLVSILLLIAIHSMLVALRVDTSPLNQGMMVNGFNFDINRMLLCLATFGFRGWLANEANNSLWSLALELRCYLAIGVLAWFILSKTWTMRIISGLVLVIVAREIWRDGRFVEFLPCYGFFALGAIGSLFIDRLPRLIPTTRMDLSYSLFILHFPVMVAICLIFYRPEIPGLPTVVLLAAVAIIISIGISWASAKWIEPIRYRLKFPAKAAGEVR